MGKDLNEIARLESQIVSEIKQDNGASISFMYDGKNGENLRVFTFNNVSKEFFLLSSVITESSEDSLKQVLHFLKTHKTDYDSYTVRWKRKGSETSNVSYFYCKDVPELIEKFFAGKDREMYVIFEIKMNAIS
jgi:hypothetical protein